MTAPETKPRDWRDTVFLPKTDFPMKAGLPQKEPGILARWQAEGAYRQLRAARAGRETFILHDGPPYANGDMHIGHALNHILKDMVCRTQSLLGKDAPYVPGWDCHGLPIEWKVEEDYRKKKLNKDDVPAAEFRAQCRAYAQKWVDIQAQQLKRLGISGDWENPYLTMDFDAEATIVAELMKFAESGQLYRGAKPVMWSPVEKTALAEAEVEYEDIVSTQIDVAFEIVECPNVPELVGAYAVIWTTTPWTIPVNQAIAYGPDVRYKLIRIGSRDGRLLNCLVAEELALGLVQRRAGLPELPPGSTYEVGWPDAPVFQGSQLSGTIARHPMAKLFESPLPLAGGAGGGSDHTSIGDDTPTPDPSRKREGGLAEFFLRPRPFLPGDFVTTEQGTGLVHMAPDHGEDDFELCKAHGLNPVFAIEGDGKYRADWAWLGGQGSVINPKFNAPDGPICEDLRTAGALLAASADYEHSYPHSWRSKAKVIFRATPQWFIPMDRRAISERPGAVCSPEIGSQSDAWDNAPPPPLAAAVPLPEPSSGRIDAEKSSHSLRGEVAARCADGGAYTLRQTALSAIAQTRFIPEKGRNRIRAMVEGRPDWVISRQRAWGVPITLFVEKKTGHYLIDSEVNARIVAAVREKGVDAWEAAAAAHFLGPDRDPADYERQTDILDVWFDSGCTHAFVLESGKWPDLQWPANLYLEGSDQHRGWFQSSLLQSCGTRGRAPYDAVLTHGFTMDAKGMKMSKSLGNTINPIDLMRDYGADILRLWALSVDFTEDHRIGKEILTGVSDQYRKLRNTFRYLLGSLDGFSEDERVSDVASMPELERYVLHLLAELDTKLRAAVDDFDFNSYTRLISDFCNNDLSAFYFDIRKDSLYCDAPTAPKRRACRTVLDTLFHALVRYLAPVLVFTTEEVWGTRYPGGGSVHLLEWPELPMSAADAPLVAAGSVLRELRAAVTEAIEPLRRDKTIGSSLEASVTISVSGGSRFEPVVTSDIDLAEMFISSSCHVHIGTIGADSALPAIGIERTAHPKCGRCWRHLPEVREDGALCGRCAAVVA